MTLQPDEDVFCRYKNNLSSLDTNRQSGHLQPGEQEGKPVEFVQFVHQLNLVTLTFWVLLTKDLPEAKDVDE